MICAPEYPKSITSTFFLSGFPGNAQTLQQATQIELILSVDLENTKDAVNIYEIFEKCKTVTIPISKICPIHYLSFYERFIETRFKSISQQAIFNTASNHFYQVKTIPQNSKEDSSISLTG